MLNFDLLDTVAGQQIYEEGVLEEARDMVIEALTERFIIVPIKREKRVKTEG